MEGDGLIGANDFARSRAERFLAQRVLHPRDEPRHLPPGLDPTIFARQREATVPAALAVFEQLGILDTDDVRKWRDAAACVDHYEPPATSSPLAMEVLQRRFNEMEAAADPSAAWRFSLTHMAATSAGLLSEPDARAWSERQQDKLAVTEADRRRLEVMRSTLFRELIRVIPGPARRPSGMTVVSVDLYTDGLIVNWLRFVDVEPGTFADLPGAVLADSVGTFYAMTSGGGSGNREQSGYFGFGPAPPPGVTELELQLGDDRFHVTLTGDGTIR